MSFFHRVTPAVAWRLDLEGDLHVVGHVLQHLGGVIATIVFSPRSKIITDGLLNIGHVESRGADGDCWKSHVCHWQGRLLQCGHHLDDIIVRITII